MFDGFGDFELILESCVIILGVRHYFADQNLYVRVDGVHLSERVQALHLHDHLLGHQQINIFPRISFTKLSRRFTINTHKDQEVVVAVELPQQCLR